MAFSFLTAATKIRLRKEEKHTRIRKQTYSGRLEGFQGQEVKQITMAGGIRGHSYLLA